MPDEPTIIVRRVKSRPSRVRDVSPSDDSPTHSLGGKLKKKHNSSQSRSRLSFGFDEQTSDGEMFKVKKTNLRMPGPAPTPPRSAGPTYTKAYLDELKANVSVTSTPSLPTEKTYSPPSFDDSFDIQGALADDATGLSADIEIPTEATISAAKEKRSRLRDSNTEQDFISLSVDLQKDMNIGPHPGSRLVREEDELGDAEDDMQEYTGARERIALGKKAREHDERYRKMEMVELINEAADEDEESTEWERAQVRRGGHVDQDQLNDVNKPKEVYQPARIPAVTPIPTLASSTARLSNMLTSLTSSHASHVGELSTLSDERPTTENKENELREMIRRAEGKYKWFSAFQDHMENVAVFLDEKFPRLEKLEDEHISLLTERYEMISKRRQQDDEDDMTLFLGVSSITPITLSGTDELGRVIPPTTSTLGSREVRLAERANRRRLRRTGSQASVPPEQEDDGYSTDGSLPPGDADDYRAALVNLAERQANILSDVQREEFREPKLGLGQWFEHWRDKFEDSYVGAWGGLALVAAWEFWARLEMVGWDPLAADTSHGLDSFKWAEDLHEFSHPPEDTATKIDDTESETLPGGNLMSSMISQVTPQLCKIIEGGAFDPYSKNHVKCVVDFAEQVEASIEVDSIRLQALLKSVLAVFRRAVTDTQELVARFLDAPGHSATFGEQSAVARRRFLARRLKLLGNMIAWRRYTGERFGVGELAMTLVRACVVPVVEIRHTDISGDILREVKKIMPSELVPQDVTSRLVVGRL